MRISWLAEKNATPAPMISVGMMLATGFDSARAAMLRISSAWVSNSQPRRRPRRFSGKGGANSSNTGAQRNLSE